MTASDYLGEPEFVGWCRVWEQAGRCPTAFADWLRDRGLDHQADAAAWAASEPERHGSDDGLGGIRPVRWPAGFRWVNTGQLSEGLMRSHLPGDVFAALDGGRVITAGQVLEWAGHPGAIAAFLDAWASARGAFPGPADREHTGGTEG